MTNTFKPRVNASSPPPINWATKPQPSSANCAHHPRTTARQLVPVFIDADRLGDLQEALREEPAPRQPNADFQEYAVIDVHILEKVLRRLSQLESNFPPSQPECDPFSEPQDLSSADLTLALSCISMSTSSIDARAGAVTQMLTNPIQSPSLPPRPSAISTTARISSPVSSPRKNSIQSPPLPVRPSAISTTARISSPVSSPRKKRYYVVLVGKCAGIYYDDW